MAIIIGCFGALQRVWGRAPCSVVPKASVIVKWMVATIPVICSSRPRHSDGHSVAHSIFPCFAHRCGHFHDTLSQDRIVRPEFELLKRIEYTRRSGIEHERQLTSSLGATQNALCPRDDEALLPVEASIRIKLSIENTAKLAMTPHLKMDTSAVCKGHLHLSCRTCWSWISTHHLSRISYLSYHSDTLGSIVTPICLSTDLLQVHPCPLATQLRLISNAVTERNDNSLYHHHS